VTERVVSELRDGDVTLIEIAPGIDLEKDVLGVMDFTPKVSPDLKDSDADGLGHLGSPDCEICPELCEAVAHVTDGTMGTRIACCWAVGAEPRWMSDSRPGPVRRAGLIRTSVEGIDGRS
jgi:hypothetical protein